ncbi:syntaxin-like [Hyposmocoma kahamanoa]|uniref:syntaxin-like n=1 Tax=Hyposmocoma kahamanoa TaxID=1477025 RepID=UPI000E6D9458|nr:syntaxin-like [Hyposmocoma kahamanoa]
MTKDRTSEFQMARDYNEPNSGKNRKSDCKGFQISGMEEDCNWIAAMETIIKAIKKIHREILLTIQTDKSCQNELENLMTDMQIAAFNLRERLHEMEKNIEQKEKTYNSLDEVPSTKKSEPASLRMMRINHSTIKHKFCTIMKEYNSMQLEYRDRCRERIRRELHVIGRDVTDHELDELLEQPLENVFVDALNERAQLTMNDVEARHRDLVKLEQSIREMQELFLNLSIIVEKQQDIVDHIEFNVSATQNYVGRAKEEVRQAERTRIRARKRTLCLLVGLAVVVAVIVVILSF